MTNRASACFFFFRCIRAALTPLLYHSFRHYYCHPPPLSPPTDGCFKSAGFLNARSWLADVREFADPHLTCILVGNKVDLCDDGTADRQSNSTLKRRQVPTEEGQLWAKEEGLLFVEASAKSGRNVDWAFEEASRDILDKIKRGVFDDNRVCCPYLHPSLLLFLLFRNSDLNCPHHLHLTYLCIPIIYYRHQPRRLAVHLIDFIMIIVTWSQTIKTF